MHGGGAVGEALASSSVGKVFFTGSVEVGRRVGEVCAQRLKGSVLELGGKDPMIVCADADLDNAISGALWGGFANAGQTCSGIERVYVEQGIAARFIDGVSARRAAAAPRRPGAVGDRDRPDDLRAISTSSSSELIDDAISAGATKLCGGPTEVAGLSGNYIAPTVLSEVTHEMRIMREEIFGPVLPIIVVENEQEAIDLANDSDFGLGASVWTRDRQKGERIARRLQSGMVWINDHSFSHGACQCSWGGVKDSGVGRSHSKFGFYECVNIKMNAWEPGLTRDFWWHPYDRTLGEAVRASAKLLYGKGQTRTERAARRRGAAAEGRRSHPAQAPLSEPAIALAALRRDFGERRVARRRLPGAGRRRVARCARSKRGRQDDAATDPRDPTSPQRRRGTRARLPAARRGLEAARQARLPWPRTAAIPRPERPREPSLPRPAAGDRSPRRRGSHRGAAGAPSVWRAAPRVGWQSFRPGCASAWRSAAASCSARHCCLLDEPDSNLDLEGRELARALIGPGEDRTRVLVTHDPGRALPDADRALVLGHGGRVLRECAAPSLDITDARGANSGAAG